MGGHESDFDRSITITLHFGVLSIVQSLYLQCKPMNWTTLTRLFFAWTYFHGYQNQNFLRGFIFADVHISVISRGLIFAVDKICI